MSDILEKDLISYDPLTEVTRKERRSLLGISMLGLALVKVPLVPTKFAVFGVEFSDVNQKSFVYLYALVIVFYTLAFLIYALSDLVAWRRSEHIRYSAYGRAQEHTVPILPNKEGLARMTIKQKPPDHAGDNPVYKGLASYKMAVFASRTRAIFEFLLPLVFAVYVLVEMYLYNGQK